MLIIVLLLIIGILAGLSIGKISAVLRLNEGILTLIVYLILFMLAFSIGVDDLIVKSIDKIGWSAFLFIIITTTAVTLTGWFLYRILSRRDASSKLYVVDSHK